MKSRSIVGRLAKRSRLILLIVTVSVFLIPTFAEAQGGNSLTVTGQGPHGVTVQWEARAGGGIVRVAFIGRAVYNGAEVSHTFYMVPGTGRTQSGEWSFTPNSPPFPSGTVVTIQMQVYGNSMRPKSVTVTVTV